MPSPRSASQAVIFFLASGVGRPSMTGELTATPSAVKQVRARPSRNASRARPADARAAGSAGRGAAGRTTSVMGRPNCMAKSKSRSSWAGTAMIAPVP